MSAASCCGFLAAHPQLEPAKLFGDSKAGQSVRCVHPHLAPAYPGCVDRAVRGRARSTGSISSSPPFRTATARRSRRRILDAGYSVRRSRRRLPARRCRDLRALVRPCAPGAGAARRSFVYGIPELNREAIRERKGGRRGRLLCDRGDPRAEAACRCRPDRSRQPDRRCRLGRQRRRPRGEGSDRLQHRRRQLLRLRAAQPSPHRRDGNGAWRHGAVHAAPRADDPRHPRHLLRARRAARATRFEALQASLCRRAVRACHRPAARDQVGERLERSPAHRPLRRAHRPRARALAPSTISARARPAR